MNPSLSPVAKFPKKNVLKLGLWILYALLCLILFTFIKFPNDKLYPYIEKPLVEFLNQKGASFTAEKRELSWIFSSYTLSGVTLYFPSPFRSQRIERIQISISRLPLLFKKISVNLEIQTSQGFFNLQGSFRGTEGKTSFEMKNLDLESLGIGALVEVRLLGLITQGKGSLAGDFMVPKTLEGGLSLSASNLTLLPQKILGFPIPSIHVDSSKASVKLEKGNLQIQTFQLGKKENFPDSDDVTLEAEGGISLLQKWSHSKPDLKLNFFLSEKITKAISILELLLSEAKQKDGGYRLSITGTLQDPLSSPVQ